MTKKVFILPMLLIGIAGFAQYSVSEISKDAYLKDFDIAVDIIKNNIQIRIAFTVKKYWIKSWIHCERKS